eukprot:4536669-Amphidinium_carterae.1
MAQCTMCPRGRIEYIAHNCAHDILYNCAHSAGYGQSQICCVAQVTIAQRMHCTMKDIPPHL